MRSLKTRLVPMLLSDYYRTAQLKTDSGDRLRAIIRQQHWFSQLVDLDPRTGEALPMSLEALLSRLAHVTEDGECRDRVWRLVEHCRASVGRIFESISESPRREQSTMPIRAVRELNASSFVALSRRPGRTVREKLAYKPYIQAVRRFQSVDLPQNQLLKEFVAQIADLLESRSQLLGVQDTLIGNIRRWLKTESASEISPWRNLPPNNTLLSHVDYRRIWNSWRWLQQLEMQIGQDLQTFDARAATQKKWCEYADPALRYKTQFANVPILFNYDSFEIRPWTAIVSRSVKGSSRSAGSTGQVEGAVCVDLDYVKPRWSSVSSRERETSREKFVWQRWRHSSQVVDIELGEGDAVMLHPDATTISCSQLLSSKQESSPLATAAAQDFARRLKSTFKSSTLVWLVPDTLNDFQMQTLRRNLNTQFANAIPLPRSIAAVVELLDYQKISHDGFRVNVIDRHQGVVYATPLTARHDEELENRVPATRGFYWERSPHIVVGSDALTHGWINEVASVDERGRWHDVKSVTPLKMTTPAEMESNEHLAGADVDLMVPGSPVRGGARLQGLQRDAGDIPLWRDHVPPLSFKALVDRRYQWFHLVGRTTTIRPIRNQAQDIPVDSTNQEFVLTAGRDSYRFPLSQGSMEADLGYIARLDAPEFPLERDVRCRLQLTYTYGSDDPYLLRVIPHEDEAIEGILPFRPITVSWRPRQSEVVTDAPSPEYPRSASWADMQHFVDHKRGKTTNYLDWATKDTRTLLQNLSLLVKLKDSVGISRGVLTTDWISKASFRENWIHTESEEFWAHERQLLDGQAERYPRGTSVSFVPFHDAGRGGKALFISLTEAGTKTKAPANVGDNIRRSLYVPFIKIWSDGRSLEDSDCPTKFREVMKSFLVEIARELMSGVHEPVVNDQLLFLLGCTHKDAPAPVQDHLLAQVVNKSAADRTLAKTLGFALGDLSMPWQRQVADNLVLRGNDLALTALARAVWRDARVVAKFDKSQLVRLLDAVQVRLEQVLIKSTRNNAELETVVRLCELLLGLLRTRDSDDSDVRMLLQPNLPRTRKFEDLVEGFAVLFVEKSLKAESRVDISIPEKPLDDKTPDLLVALKLYLAGDVGTDAIQITQVVDDDAN